ncbi:GAF domain-containing protein [Scytonema sp. UIC 10036]|uniref:DICT sensory domain-containing protein n=1 Tax=Scytonema sp. UIC 10036 TaxID=2304196 RepID=UPI0012DA710C|nr:DICT sensory domain-containing protein [Scytonema sp. UIC 10036]MUG93025.1 GAF domain-containing protein [Scytonema sp. UIC 10036]
MKTSNSLLHNLLQAVPNLRCQVYFKSSLTALSHAMEDLILVGVDKPLVIANFQQERYYLQETRRYQRIAQRTDQVYVLAAPEANFKKISEPLVAIPFHPEDALAQEWHLVIIGQQYSACIVCQEYASPVDGSSLDQARQFKGIWTFDREVSIFAAKLLMERILNYRPDLAGKVEVAWQRYGLTQVNSERTAENRVLEIDARLFTDRLVTYLQNSQYKQLKAYRTITKKERQERLINTISTAIRQSLNPEEIFAVTVKELTQVFSPCRCLLYRYHPTEKPTPIEYEALADGLASLKGKIWSLAKHPLFQTVLSQDKSVAIADTTQDLGIQAYPELSKQLQAFGIRSCLVVPIRYHQKWLGILELHHCSLEPLIWNDSDKALVEAIATQVAVALIQAQAYSNLETLNHQLAALERTQSNLIAIVGHELRTPLSTIQVCLESIANEPDMPIEFQQSMLQTALADSERMRRLIQDFLTLSRLEGGWMNWQIEPVSLQTCLDLVISSLKRSQADRTLPSIVLELPSDLPLVLADGDGLTEVVNKLLDNACKFTDSKGKVTIRAQILNAEERAAQGKEKKSQMIEVIIADTGRGIEPNQLEAIFARFYQEEGFMQRSIGGTGLGLAICRQIIEKLGGKIWAVSAGREQGAEFHFTLPVAPIP